MLIGTSIIFSIYLIVIKPFDIPLMNRVEIFNELVVLGSLYHMLIFSEALTQDPKMIYSVGWSMNLLLLTQFVLNMIHLAIIYSVMIYRVCKRALLHYHANR